MREYVWWKSLSVRLDARLIGATSLASNVRWRLSELLGSLAVAAEHAFFGLDELSIVTTTHRAKLMDDNTEDCAQPVDAILDAAFDTEAAVTDYVTPTTALSLLATGLANREQVSQPHAVAAEACIPVRYGDEARRF